MTKAKRSLLCWVMLTACSASAWSAPTPPPTNVRASAITAIDAVTASFVLEWSPALAPDGKPYAST